MSERDDFLREQAEWEESDEGRRALCETCAMRQGPEDFTGAFAVDDERFCGECNRALGTDATLRAAIDTEILNLLREGTDDDTAHGVSTLWPLTGSAPSLASPGGRLKRETILAALKRLEAQGRARRDDSGFDHLDEDEDGWWHVITPEEERATNDAIRAMVTEEQKGYCPGCGARLAGTDERYACTNRLGRACRRCVGYFRAPIRTGGRA